MDRSAMRLVLVLASLLFSILPPLPSVAQPAAGDDSRASRAGFGFGLGLLAFTDRQGSLRNTFSQSTVTLIEPLSGTSSTTVLDLDPELNNRKFDFDLDLTGAGVVVPVRLPSPGGGSYSFAVRLEVAETAVSFESLDATAGSALSSAFSGSGPMFGVVLESRVCASPLCRSIWSAGYAYRYLPRLDVDRGSVSGDPGFGVLEDEVSIRRDAHEVSTRIGYSLGAGDRYYAPYAGVLYRDVEVEIEDRIRIVDGLEIDRTQETVSRFESDGVLAVVGFEAKLADSIFGNLESFFGEGDYGVRFQVAWRPQVGFPLEWGEATPERRERRSRKRVEKEEKVLSSLYPAILACLGEIESRFDRRRRDLEAMPASVAPDVYRQEVRDLLDVTKPQLVSAFSRGESATAAGAWRCRIPMSRRQHRLLAPLRDYVEYHHGRALEELEQGPSPVREAEADVRVASLGLATVLERDEPGPRLAQGDEGGGGLKAFLTRVVLENAYKIPLLRTVLSSERCRSVYVRFESPTQSATLDFRHYHAEEVRARTQVLKQGGGGPVRRGVYGWVWSDGSSKQSVTCSAAESEIPNNCPLDLIRNPCPELKCQLTSVSEDSTLRGCFQYGSAIEGCGGSSCDVVE